MNFNFDNTNTTVTNLPPIVTRNVNVVHRYQIINQPHICEDVTQICNHLIKRHQYVPRPMCCTHTDYVEENLGCCPNMQQNEDVNPTMFNNNIFTN